VIVQCLARDLSGTVVITERSDDEETDMWTPEAINAEVNYRRNGTMDRTARLHLHEIRRGPTWLSRVFRHRTSRRAD
jgi:hypothetical protein